MKLNVIQQRSVRHSARGPRAELLSVECLKKLCKSVMKLRHTVKPATLQNRMFTSTSY